MIEFWLNGGLITHLLRHCQQNMQFSQSKTWTAAPEQSKNCTSQKALVIKVSRHVSYI